MPKKFQNPRAAAEQSRSRTAFPIARDTIAARPRPVRRRRQRQYERYLALARAALMNGDDIEAQNFYQHAEQFFRTMREQDATELVEPANRGNAKTRIGARADFGGHV